MSQKFLVNDFKWFEYISEFNEEFVKDYNDERDEGYFIELDIQSLGILHNLYNALTFLPEKMKIEKGGKFVANSHYKTGIKPWISIEKSA